MARKIAAKHNGTNGAIAAVPPLEEPGNAVIVSALATPAAPPLGDDDFATVAQAAQIVDPRIERQLFRAVKHGRVPSGKREGVTFVRVGDVRRWAGERHGSPGGPFELIGGGARPAMPPSTAVSAGVVPSSGHGGGVGGGVRSGSMSGPALDGDTCARIFSLLGQGVEPTSIVESEKIPPAVVAHAVQERARLRDLGGPRADPNADLRELIERVNLDHGSRIAQLEAVLAGALARLDEVERAATQLARFLVRRR